MNYKFLFHITLVISIIIQFITGIFGISALFIKVPSEVILIRQLLILEVIVQIIEGIFYYWLAYNYIKVVNITPDRYMDWVITTPTMLITLILYFIYLDNREKSPINEDLNFFPLITKNYSVITQVLILNWLMLLFGYLGEMKIISIFTGVILGFVPFCLFFYLIYKNYYTENGGALFWYFLFFWSLYGFVALLPYYLKNSFYNILDLFSKNIFGIFLSYLIITGNY